MSNDSEDEKEEMNAKQKKKKRTKGGKEGEGRSSSEGGFNPFELCELALSSELLPITACPISKVTVLNNAMAEITRTLKYQAGGEGRFDFLLSSLPPSLDPSSLRVSSLNGCSIILEVSFEEKREKKEKEKERLEEMKKEMEGLEEELLLTNSSLEILNKKIEYAGKYMEKVMGISKEPANFTELLSASSISKLSAFIDKQQNLLDDLRASRHVHSSKLSELKKKIASSKEEIGRLSNAPVDQSDRIITISTYSRSPLVEVAITYAVRGASWQPSYDVRIDSKSKSIEITYYGSLSQSTGEAWNNVVLSLSTAKPRIGHDIPKLQSALISKRPTAPSPITSTPTPSKVKRSATPHSLLSSPSSPSSLSTFLLSDLPDDPPDDEKKPKSKRREKPPPSPRPPSPRSSSPRSSSPRSSSSSLLPSSSTNATFVIPRRCSIASGSQPHKVTIGIIALSADFIYRSIPKLAKFAYLNVSALNSSEFPLLSGLCSVFFDNSFVSSSSISSISPGDKLDFYIGVDESIEIKYKTIRQQKEEKGIFTKTNNETHEVLTVIKNTKSIDVKVRVYDQLPRSLDEKLKVKMITPNLSSVSYVKLDQITNNLEWEFTVPAGARVRVPFAYELEWPKDKYLIDISS